jgi:non-ribosomal peptide synthetase-like protein
MSASSFALRDVRIGAQTYLGNTINVPPGSRIGDNCLLATKVMLPIDGPVREGVGLLGSPAFEIPRIVERDQRLKVDDEAEMARLVAGKTRYNLATIAIYLAFNWVQIAVTTFLFVAAILHFADYGFAAILAFGWLSALFTILYFVLIERAAVKFGRLQPLVVSMYDRRFWLHERHWKFSTSFVDALLPGTPWRNVVMRLLGMRVGRRVFDDGAVLIDRTLIEVGDFACLNEDCWLQAHSLEEGAFKADYVRVGRGVTVGTWALVHYGTTVGDNAVIDPDAFVMKGESPEPDTTWRGNPARAVRKAAAASRMRPVRLPTAAEGAAP